MAARTLEQYHRDVIAGSQGGVRAALFRAALRSVEPFYALATRARNGMFNCGLRSAVRVPRPVISIGNITTGGTGKTPVVAWLAHRLTTTGRRPAVLLRGYKGGDEQRMLRSQLPTTFIEPDPARAAGARRVLSESPQVSVFLLDDGFQHRQIHRDFDLVLIDASNPFGFEHVLPRGLLREPLRGLARAHAFLITHAEQVAAERLAEIESTLRRYNVSAPIFRCEHLHRDFAGADVSNRKVLAFCGIGNPAAFDAQLDASAIRRVGSQWFGDHHAYTSDDLAMLRDLARQRGAETLVTTEKDWVKLSGLVQHVEGLPPIARAQLAIRFIDEAEAELFSLITRKIGLSQADEPSAAESTGADSAPADAGD
jgi:tetraacyldisaccharide 4'-kinase